MAGELKMGKRLSKRGVSLATTAAPRVHDRKATDLLRNAQVVVVEVDDPLEFGAKIQVLASVRDDPLRSMHNARQLDDAQYNAGRRWQRNKDLADIGGGVNAIDPSVEAVDGGLPPEARLSDARIVAFKEMTRAYKALGGRGIYLMGRFLDEGLTIARIAMDEAAYTKRDRHALGVRVRECLDTLALVFGFSSGRDSRKHGVIHREAQDVDEMA